jgi:lipoprotein-anchoring transpeptidase ErfK/SrfK
MRRWLVVLAAAVVAWWGYNVFFVPGAGSTPAAEPGPDQGGIDVADLAPATPPSPPAAEPLQAQPLHVRQDPSPHAAVLARARSGDREAVAELLRLQLREIAPPTLAVFSEVLQEVARRSEDSRALMEMLGGTNAFLHSKEGRALAHRVLAAAQRENAEQASLTLSRLATACMRGDLGPNATEAQECVQSIRSALMNQVQHTALNPSYAARARTHEVKAGDSLEAIAKRARRDGLRVDAGTLAAVNRISDPKRIRTGLVIKVPVEEVWTLVEKRSYLMAVYVGDVMIRLYRVAHGKNDCTPEASFTIGEKKSRPDWYVDGKVIPYGHPDNVLGDYWVQFEHASFSGIGAHGTSDPASIGTMASKGCIRLGDADIRDFFELVPRGSRIVIQASR